jgi:hypothetical protein
MGYRSDVVLVMYPEDPKDMPALKLFASENIPDKFEEVKRDAPGIPVYLRWRWDNVKWYEEFPEVDAVEDIMHRWEDLFWRDDGYHYHYEFIRIGEELEDIESRGTETNILYVARTICEE